MGAIAVSHIKSPAAKAMIPARYETPVVVHLSSCFDITQVKIRDFTIGKVAEGVDRLVKLVVHSSEVRKKNVEDEMD